MNIDNIETEAIEIPPTPKEILQAIFAKQQELMAKYDQIERRNGAIVPEPPYILDDRFVQYRLKDLFWRVTEEFAEALEVEPNIQDHEFIQWKEYWEKSVPLRHFYEEISDALHFLIEASHISGLANRIGDLTSLWNICSSMTRFPERIRDECAEIVWELGLAANTLKNKPWKNTHMPTDQVKFEHHLILTWRWFFSLLCHMGCTPQDTYLLYFKKNAVNQFRQRSNY